MADDTRIDDMLKRIDSGVDRPANLRDARQEMPSDAVDRPAQGLLDRMGRSMSNMMNRKDPRDTGRSSGSRR